MEKENRSDGEIIEMSIEEFLKENKFLKENCEEYILKIENSEQQETDKCHMKYLDYAGIRLKDHKEAGMEILLQVCRFKKTNG